MPTLTEFDKDGDGLLDEDELRQSYFQGPENSFKVLFDSVDSDKNGNLNREEMNTFFVMIGRSHLEVNKLFRSLDSNGDGRISFSEFNQWLKEEVISQSFDVKNCEMSLANATREMTSNARQQAQCVENLGRAKEVVAKLEEEEKPLIKKRAALKSAMVLKQKEAEKIKEQLAMMSRSMHETAQLMKKCQPKGKHLSGIALMQIGHQSHQVGTRGRGGASSRQQSPLQRAGNASLRMTTAAPTFSR